MNEPKQSARQRVRSSRRVGSQARLRCLGWAWAAILCNQRTKHQDNAILTVQFFCTARIDSETSKW